VAVTHQHGPGVSVSVGGDAIWHALAAPHKGQQAGSTVFIGQVDKKSGHRASRCRFFGETVP